MNNDEFAKELEHAINRCSQENGSNTPDFILAQYLLGCLAVFNDTVKRREKWYGREADSLGSIATVGMILPSPGDNIVVDEIGEYADLQISVPASPTDTSGLCGCDGPTRRDPNCKWHGPKLYHGHLDPDCEVARQVGHMCTCQTEAEKAERARE